MTNSESPLTNSVHAGYDPREHFGSVIPPLYPSVAFEFGDFDRSLRLANGEEAGFTYGRSGNPTVHTLEGRVSALSGQKHVSRCGNFSLTSLSVTTGVEKARASSS